MASIPVSIHSTSLQAKTVTISMSKSITICSLYLPPSENLNIVLLYHLIDQLPTPFVICGGFNGHSMTWGCDKNNSRGDKIDEFIMDNNICLLNDGSYTYWHPATGTLTAIDLSICSPSICMEIISVIFGLPEPKLDEHVMIINVPAGINMYPG